MGLELRPEVVFHPSVIERFIVVGTKDLSGPARRCLRTNLRHVSRRVLGGPGPDPTPLARERAKAPYTQAEIAAYLGLADAQPTLARRMRAIGLICLGAGAGLTGTDLREVRGSDVIARSGGLVVEVRGRRPRVVPVLGRYHLSLVASAAFAGEDWLIGGLDPGRRNVVTPLISALSGGSDLDRLDIRRLRSTWLTGVADSLGLKAFMEAAGIVCSQRLGDLVSHLGPIDEAASVDLLGGAP